MQFNAEIGLPRSLTTNPRRSDVFRRSQPDLHRLIQTAFYVLSSQAEHRSCLGHRPFGFLSASEFLSTRWLEEAQGSSKGSGTWAASFGSFSCPQENEQRTLGVVVQAFYSIVTIMPGREWSVKDIGKLIYLYPTSLLYPLCCRASAIKQLFFGKIAQGLDVPTAGSVCCDSGNNEEMLRGEPGGVVVDNFSPELEKLRHMKHVFFARGTHTPAEFWRPLSTTVSSQPHADVAWGATSTATTSIWMKSARLFIRKLSSTSCA